MIKTSMFRKLPRSRDLTRSLERALRALSREEPGIRPPGSDGAPGGLIQLKPLPTVIISDLHGRVGYLRALLAWTPPGTTSTVYQRLVSGEIQVVCVGDGFHAEARGMQRWKTAFEEFSGGFKKHTAMDAEMGENLRVMMTVMELKTAFPGYFHFLKGNHENIANENYAGNRPFGKFAAEGAMVTSWFRKFMETETFRKYYEFEKRLPIFAVGNRFCVAHAEPRKHHSRKELVEAMIWREIIFDMTWTANGEAAENGVEKYLEEYFPGDPEALMFGGHRPVSDKFNLRAGGKYIQIHNPNKYIAVYIRDMSDFSLAKNILILPGKGT